MGKHNPKPNIIRSSGGQLAVRMDIPISSKQRKQIADFLTLAKGKIDEIVKRE